MKHKKKEDLNRLLDLLDAKDCVQPLSLREAEQMAQHSGGSVERRRGVRKDNQCGKMCFNSEPQAKSVARRRLNIGSNVSRLRTYFCKVCAAWHITSSIRP